MHISIDDLVQADSAAAAAVEAKDAMTQAVIGWETKVKAQEVLCKAQLTREVCTSRIHD